MRLSRVVLTIVVLAAVPVCLGQHSAPGRRAAAPAGLSVDDVIKLVKAGLSDDIILQQLKKKNRPFDLTTDQLIALKAANVSDRIVAFMLDPSQPETAPAAPPAPDAAPGPAAPSSAALATLPPPPAFPASAVMDAALPTEAGVYVKKQNQWAEVAPEIVYWKTGGALKTIVTAGVLHGDINGRVIGTASHTAYATPLELLVVAPEGVALAEYQLIRMRPNKDSREFRTVTGGVFHAQSGSFRDVVSFDGKKLANRTYQITFPSSAGPGEYGVLPPASNSGSGKIYSFRITGAETN